jgi:hypothetical protein
VPETVRRRQAKVKGGRPVKYDVRVSVEQAEQLAARAETEGVTVPKLLVDTTLGTPPVEAKTVLRELAGVRRIVAGEAVNINQIAHAANVGGMPEPDELEGIRAALDRQNELLTERFGKGRS